MADDVAAAAKQADPYACKEQHSCRVIDSLMPEAIGKRIKSHSTASKLLQQHSMHERTHQACLRPQTYACACTASALRVPHHRASTPTPSSDTCDDLQFLSNASPPQKSML